MKKRREAGVGFLIKVDPNINIKETNILDPRMMALNLKIYGFNIRIVNVYAPTESDSNDSKKDSFYRLLKKVCIKTEKHEKLIVAGDFNAKTSLAFMNCYYDGTKVIPDDICNGNGSRLKSFCMKNRMCIASTYFDYENENRYTWYSCDGKTKRVNDYVLTEKYVQRFVTECIANPRNDFDSDHRILITSLTTPMTRKARRQPKRKSLKRKTLDIRSLKNKDIKKEFLHSIKSQLVNMKKEPQSELEHSKNIVDTLNMAAENTLPVLKRQNRCKEVWKEDKEFNRLLTQRQQLLVGSIEYKKVTKAVKKRVTHLRNEILKREADEINANATRKELKQLYNNMKEGNTTFGKIKETQHCDSNTLKQYFKAHFNTENKTGPLKLGDAPNFIKYLQEMDDVTINTEPPDIGEIRSTIYALKNGKSANDIPASYVKIGMECKEFTLELVKLIHTVWKTNKIPVTWGHSKLVALWKGPSKGNQDDPKTYRGVQIGSTLCKILIIIIINRLRTWYDKQLMDQQQGFRPERGTSDGIYMIKRVHHITDGMKKPIYAIFVDLAAAFDRVDRKLMFETICHRLPPNSNTKLIQLMESLYSHTTAALSQTPDDIFEITRGVRQGGPESPFLFNLFMDYVMRVYLEKCKNAKIESLRLNYKIPSSAAGSNLITTGTQTIDWGGYADDLVLLFENVRNLQQALNLLYVTFGDYGLEINKEKTKTMILNHQYLEKSYPSSIAKIENISIENVNCFKYLGCNIKYDEPSTGETEIKLRVDSAQCKFYELAKNLLNHRIMLQTRVKILNALVRSRLTYSCQTWNLTRKQTDHINSIYISMLRKMVKGGYRRKHESYAFVMSNSDILTRCHSEPIHQFIMKQQRKFIANIIRKENTRLTKRLLFNNDAKIKRGRTIDVYRDIVENEKITKDVFNQNAIAGLY